jgi:hypothetical protein
MPAPGCAYTINSAVLSETLWGIIEARDSPAQYAYPASRYVYPAIRGANPASRCTNTANCFRSPFWTAGRILELRVVVGRRGGIARKTIRAAQKNPAISRGFLSTPNGLIRQKKWWL